VNLSCLLTDLMMLDDLLCRQFQAIVAAGLGAGQEAA
jgi:hypothetical protein